MTTIVRLEAAMTMADVQAIKRVADEFGYTFELVQAPESVNVGRLFQLKLKRNAAAREDALASVRELPNGRWQARIGGRLRGQTNVYFTRDHAEAAVHIHYNAVMARFVDAHRRAGGWS